MGEKRKPHPSKNHSGNNNSAAYQGRSAEKTDDIRKKGIELAVESKIQPDVSDLVSKVVGFKDLGGYEDIAKTVEELILSFKKHSPRKNKAKGLDPQKRRLCESANNWFKPNPKGRRKTGSERDLYPSIINYIFLISMVIAEFGRETRGMAIQRRILPHRECDVRCDAEANIHYDIVLRCCGSQVDVEQEYGTFEDDSNLSDGEYKPSKEHKTSEKKEMAKFRKWIKEAFGVIEVKTSAKEDGRPKIYAQLGWYIRCALNAQFDRNNMWGITVCGPLVRFVLFTHSTVIPSLPIDMGTSEGRKQFVDDYIRLSLCPKYRVGYDPTKTWLPDLKRWEVECFDTNQSNNEQGAKGPCESVYVDPEPITSGGHLFGRRTRCHLASLSKKGELTFVLKESWTEVDGPINTVEVPNEVRVFKHIEKVDLTLRYPLTEKGIPKMKFGGAVCIRKEDVHGDMGQTGQWCYDTMSHYCGELKMVTDRSPSASQGESAESENVDEPKEWVERVHQRLLLTPAGKPMTTLHPYDTRSEVPTELPPEKASDFNRVVKHFFKRLFLIIFILHRQYGIYHRDLSEGNVLVVENEIPNLKEPGKTEKNPVPLLIDFDHARLKNDEVVDQMSSRTGTLPFMSILNLAGHTNHLTFIDECESFLYLFVWKCIIGFARCQISLPATTKLMTTVTGKNSTSHPPLSKGVAGGSKGKAPLDPAKANPVGRGEAQPVQGGAPHPSFEEKMVHHWVSNEPIEAIEDMKRLHMDSRATFTMVLKGLRPEFRQLWFFFHDLRDALFTWEGGSGAIITEKETTAKATAGPSRQRTGRTDPVILLDKLRQLRMGRLPEKNNINTTESTVEMHDPLLERAKYEEEVTENFLAVMFPEVNS
ncbi:hypothetical protein IWQ61_004011 [Dispira simplex]|nr:hypothetical protein IWQ61_004011 [Dispira simplex]